MPRVVSLLLLLVAGGLALEAAQGQVRGQVVNRDGVAQQCQVDFYADNALAYRLASDRQGYFYITKPRAAAYRVVVVQSGKQFEFKRVTIDDYGLHPSTLIVPW